MKEIKDDMDELMEGLKGQWDSQEPVLGHQQRFLDRLQAPKKKKNKYVGFLAIAASLVIFAAVLVTYNQTRPQSQLAKMSPEVKETHQYFNSIIKKELAEIVKESSPENKVMVQDALKQMQQLDKDYNKLMAELAEKGENEQIINAMITNLQTRISFLQKVQAQIENIKKLKASYHEKTTL